jgi:hypothetical protein
VRGETYQANYGNSRAGSSDWWGAVVAQQNAKSSWLHEAGEILGIPLLDHIVFSETVFYSFQKEYEL